MFIKFNKYSHVLKEVSPRLMVLTCHSKQSLRFKINYALKASIIRLVQSSSYLMIKAERNPDQLKMPTLQIFGKVTSERQQKFPTQDDKFSKMKALINLLLVFLFLHICLQVRISLLALLLSAQKNGFLDSHTNYPINGFLNGTTLAGIFVLWLASS